MNSFTKKKTLSECELVKVNKRIEIILDTIHINSDPLVIVGALLQFGISQIPVAGGVLSLLFNLLWPISDVDIWNSIKAQVKQLVDDEIDNEEWEVLQNKINEIKDKNNTYSKELATGKYDLAINTFNTLITFLDGIEENFKINGHRFGQSFSPLYSVVINLKIIFFIESYSARKKMKLSTTQIDKIKNMLSSTVNNAKSYLSSLEDNVINNGISDVVDYTEFCSYYYSGVIYYVNYMWHDDIEWYLKENAVFQCRIPVRAFGTFINADADIFLTNQEICKCSQDGCNDEMDYKDDDGYYQAPPITPLVGANDLIAMTIYQDKAEGRCTGIYYSINLKSSPDGRPSRKSINLGKTEYTNFDPEYTVQGATASFVNNHICKASIWASTSESQLRFVSRIGFYSLENTNIEIGQYDDSDHRYDIKIPQPFNLCTIMGPSDVYSYYRGSGHELGGIGLGAIYNNELAKNLIKNISATLYEGVSNSV